MAQSLISDLQQAVSCPVCTNQANELYRQPDFNILRCQSCETVFVSPRKQAAATLLQEEHQAREEGAQYIQKVFVERHDFWVSHWTERLQEIDQHVSEKGYLLDVGCAMGHFQLAAEQQGWRTVGVEFSDEQVLYARNTLGLDVRSGYFEEVDFSTGSFDLITLWSVIEHVPNPVEFLQNTRRLLKDDGLLALQTPNQNSLLTLLAHLGYKVTNGRYLLGIYSLDHIFRFNQQTLQTLLERTGYEIVEIKPYDNLDVMLARMCLQPYPNIRHGLLWLIHKFAALLNRQNQLVVYARPR